MTVGDHTVRYRSGQENNEASNPKAQDTEEKPCYKGKLALTIRERINLELIMTSPIWITVAILFTTHSFLLTLVSFHIVLMGGAMMFMKKKGINFSWGALLKQDLQKYARKLNNDIKIMMLPVVMLMAFYIWFRRTVPDFDYSALRLPSMHDLVLSGLLAIEFIFVNPIVEELFWRHFCDLFTGQGKTWLNKLDVAIHFASYHWFVGYFLSQHLLMSTVAFFGIMTLGLILTIIKEKAGLVTAMVFSPWCRCSSSYRYLGSSS